MLPHPAGVLKGRGDEVRRRKQWRQQLCLHLSQAPRPQRHLPQKSLPGTELASPAAQPSAPSASSLPGRGAARWPLVRPQGAGQGQEGRPDTIPGDGREGLSAPSRALQAPGLHPRLSDWGVSLLLSPGPSLFPSVPPDLCWKANWKAHFKALRFEQISVG